MIFFDLGDIKGDSRMKYIYTAVYLLFQMRTMYLILMFMISKNLDELQKYASIPSHS